MTVLTVLFCQNSLCALTERLLRRFSVSCGGGRIIAPLFDCSSVCLLVFYSSIRLLSSPVFPSFKMSRRLSSFLLEEEIW